MRSLSLVNLVAVNVVASAVEKTYYCVCELDSWLGTSKEEKTQRLKECEDENVKIEADNLQNGEIMRKQHEAVVTLLSLEYIDKATSLIKGSYNLKAKVSTSPTSPAKVGLELSIGLRNYILSQDSASDDVKKEVRFLQELQRKRESAVEDLKAERRRAATGILPFHLIWDENLLEELQKKIDAGEEAMENRFHPLNPHRSSRKESVFPAGLEVVFKAYKAVYTGELCYNKLRAINTVDSKKFVSDLAPMRTEFVADRNALLAVIATNGNNAIFDEIASAAVTADDRERARQAIEAATALFVGHQHEFCTKKIDFDDGLFSAEDIYKKEVSLAVPNSP